MADPTHLAFLDRGVDAWNAARREAPGGDAPNLADTDLSGRALAGIDFSYADLRRANLAGCTLDGADLSHANLSGCDLTGARLVGAQLYGARLVGARLDATVFADASQHLGDADQLAVLLRGPQAWLDWRRDNPDIVLDLPEDTGGCALVRTTRALADGTARIPFAGDPAHLALLTSGVERWNAWRDSSPGTRPDLRGAYLPGAALSRINLQEVDLGGAVLASADLSGANLAGAMLAEAWLPFVDLNGATLVSATLFRTNLVGASLEGANFYGAMCAEATLTGACLDRAQLDGARLEQADFFEGNAQHLALLYSCWPDARVWTEWRTQHRDVAPDLRGANLMSFSAWDADLAGARLQRAHLSRVKAYKASLADADLTRAALIQTDLFDADLAHARLDFAVLAGATLSAANLTGASLVMADLRDARLTTAVLRDADLHRAMLHDADLGSADLTGACLVGAYLSRANLSRANLRDADLTNASLTRTLMVETILDGATLTGAAVYGVSAWSLDLSKVRDQSNLQITPEGSGGLTVDNLELAQFVYLMVHNEKLRDVIDTIGRKAVLILGRFYAERKVVLDALKARLRELDLVPIVFDWDKPTRRDLTETVALLANMSRFVVADVTDAKSIPQELAEIVPRLPSVPVQPILLQGDAGYAMFEHWKGYRTMLPVFQYRDQADLLDHVQSAILAPVEAWESGVQAQSSLQDALNEKDAEIERLRALLRTGGSAT